MKRDIFSFGKAEEDARLAPCYDDNAARRKKSRFKAWFGFDALAYPDEGFRFVGWYENGTKVSGEETWIDEYGASRVLKAAFEREKTV